MIVSSYGVFLIFVVIFLLLQRIGELFAAAYIKTNAVEVSQQQLPDIHRVVVEFSERVGKKAPSVYVMQANVWNAFATKLAGKRIVVLFSGAVDSILLKGNKEQLSFLVGHELGHHFAGHLNFWRTLTVMMGSWCIWIRLWYSRRCEFTSDRYGLACCNSLNEGQRAVCNMAVGAHLASEVNVDEAIAQWQRHRREFFVRYRTMYSTHPHTLCRLDELRNSASYLNIPI
jgi:Zn-dependent protease with chaperone function